MISNPGDKELKYFQLFWSGGVDNTRWKKVQSDPMLIFVSGNQCYDSSNVSPLFHLCEARMIPTKFCSLNPVLKELSLRSVSSYNSTRSIKNDFFWREQFKLIDQDI